MTNIDLLELSPQWPLRAWLGTVLGLVDEETDAKTLQREAA